MTDARRAAARICAVLVIAALLAGAVAVAIAASVDAAPVDTAGVDTAPVGQATIGQAPAGAAPDASVLILVHSWSGRTAIVGRAWAAMLGARFLRFGDAPPPYASSGSSAPSLEQVRAKLDLRGVRRIYLGFPIWARSPAGPAAEALAALDLAGRQVVLFYTYLHQVEEPALEELERRLRASGAEILPRIGMRVPVAMSPGHLERRADQALLARSDLWSTEPKPVVDCGSSSAASHRLCRIPAGNVWIGDDGSDESPPGSVAPRRVAVSAFEIDRAEVTIEQYQGCVRAGRCAAIEDHDPCSWLVADGDDKPAPCVSLKSARAYCAWVGMRLPNEAEWIRAARGDGAAPYPWGSAPIGASDPPRGNFGEKRGTGLEGYSLVEPERAWPVDGAARLARGCSYPAGNSPFGVCDLAGNIAEWVEPAPGESAAVFKGGSWMDPDEWTFRIASRGWLSLERDVPSVGFYLTGFRCARSVTR